MLSVSGKNRRMNDVAARRIRWPALLLAATGSTGFAAAWVLLACAHDRQSSWMALLAAMDAVFLLRLARMPSGAARGIACVAATAFAVALANWGIAALQVGRMMGLTPWESLDRLGLAYGWTLATLANGPADLAWLAASLVLAFLAGR